MNDAEENLAIYNEPLNFIVTFNAPCIKEIYSSFIIEETLHRALTFNYKNSSIKCDGEIITGNFQYDDDSKILKIEIENPALEKNTDIQITIATNITDLAAIIESNYIVSNIAYIKIKGYEDIDGLITKSNLINIKFDSVKVDIRAERITDIVPAIDGEKISAKVSFHTLDTNVNYDILVKNNIGENLTFNHIQSYASIDGRKIENLEFVQEGTCVSVKFHNTNDIKNKKIDIIMSSKIQNAQFINDMLSNEFVLCINNVECSRDSIQVPLIKPISILTNTFISNI